MQTVSPQADQRDRSSAPEIVVSCSEQDSAWDSFVIGGANPHHEQTALWGQLQKVRGWNAFRVMIRQDDTVIGGAQILERSVGRLWKVGYVSRGPLLASDDAGQRQWLLSAIKQAAAQRHLTYLAVTLPYPSHLVPSDLEASGFSLRHECLPPTTAMTCTLVFDLTQDLSSLMSQMSRTTRRYVRQGERRGLTLHEGRAEDMDAFEHLMVTLCRRRGVSPNIPQGEFLRKLWSTFAPSGYLKLFLTRYHSEPVSALLVFAMGDWARAWRVGWSGNYSSVRPNELMYWESIKWAKNHGYRFYDFVGFDTKNAHTLVDGGTISEGERCGMSDFKLGFGGRIVVLAPGYCYFANPVIRFAYRTVGMPLLRSRVFQRLTNRLTTGRLNP